MQIDVICTLDHQVVETVEIDVETPDEARKALRAEGWSSRFVMRDADTGDMSRNQGDLNLAALFLNDKAMRCVRN